MNDRAGRNAYSRGAIALHWLIAAALLFQIGLGWRMEGPPGPERFAVFQLHKSVGLTILMLTLLRIGWRSTHRPPAFPETMKHWERSLAHVVHFGFYALLLGLPLSGWLIVSTSRIAVATFLYGIVPWPHVPGTAGLGAAGKAGLHEAAEFSHHALVYLAYALLALHVAGALKHHFVDRGQDLRRMLPASAARLTLALGLIAALMMAALIVGRLLPLGAPAQPVAALPPPQQAAPPVEARTAPPAPAAAPPTENADEAAVAEEVESARWIVDSSASTLGFATRWGDTAVRGQFTRWTADILFDPKALDRSSVKVRIDMASVATGSPDTETALPGDDWFAAARYPSATFEANSFRRLGRDRYEARGTLRLRDASHPLTLPFTLNITGDRARMSGSARIDRTRFGVGQGQWSATGEIPAEVTVDVELSATRRADDSPAGR